MPILSLFAPLPLALMIPFMAAQSFAMGEAFGKGFQSGKRRVSSMTNEKFNATTQAQLFKETTADINAMIPAMKAQMKTFTFLQSDIIQELIGYIKELPQDIYQGLTNTSTQPNKSEIINTVFGVGTGGAQALAKFSAQDYETLKDKILEEANELINQAKGLVVGGGGSVSKDATPERVQTPTTSARTFNSLESILARSIAKGTTNLTVGAQSIASHKKFDEPIHLPRAPSSIRTQWNKYVSELKSLTLLIQRYKSASGSTSRDTDRYFARQATVKAAMRALKAKYNFGQNLTMGFDTYI